MPAKKKNISVLKRARQAEVKRQRNRSVNSKIKTLTKKVMDAVEAGSKDILPAVMKEAEKGINSACSKGVLHRNTASRKVSRLARMAARALKAEVA